MQRQISTFGAAAMEKEVEELRTANEMCENVCEGKSKIKEERNVVLYKKRCSVECWFNTREWRDNFVRVE